MNPNTQWMNKQNVIYPDNGKQFSIKKEQITIRHGWSQNQYAEWKKKDATESIFSYSIHIKILRMETNCEQNK